MERRRSARRRRLHVLVRRLPDQRGAGYASERGLAARWRGDAGHQNRRLYGAVLVRGALPGSGRQVRLQPLLAQFQHPAAAAPPLHGAVPRRLQRQGGRAGQGGGLRHLVAVVHERGRPRRAGPPRHRLPGDQAVAAGQHRRLRQPLLPAQSLLLQGRHPRPAAALSGPPGRRQQRQHGCGDAQGNCRRVRRGHLLPDPRQLPAVQGGRAGGRLPHPDLGPAAQRGRLRVQPDLRRRSGAA